VNLLTLAPQEKDLFKIVNIIRQQVEYLSRKPGIVLGGHASNVDLNAANTDNAIQITSLWTDWVLHSVVVKNKGTTASLTAATAGLFTATGGGGAVLAANQALNAITSNAVNTDRNLTSLALSAPFVSRNHERLYFRVGTAQGAAATADVYLFIQPLP
jgi:hypothetical protein